MKISYLIEKLKYAELTSEYQKLLKEARTITPGKMKLQILLED
jgi:TRAP-type mannitol/chloroaromatic compound transport system substrate-binding protein